MSHAGAANGVKNVLLVHGGFVDGSGWEGVYKILKKDGFSVTIVQNPTLSLAGDVAVTKRALAAQGGQEPDAGREVSAAAHNPERTRPEEHASSGRSILLVRFRA